MSRSTENAKGARRSIDDLLKVLEKTSATQGATSHPSKSVDDGTHDVSLGAHGNDDNATLKEQEALGVAKATPNTAGQQTDAQTNMGIQAKPTGEDPSVEDDYKDTKDDPGSTMPARTDNSSLNGSKYAGVRDSFTKAAADLTALLVQELNGSQGNAAAPVKEAAAAAPATTETKEAAAGRTLAEVVIGGELSEQEKQAADAIAMQEITLVVKQASQMANDLADYYRGHQKSAEEAAEAAMAAEAGGAQPGSPAGGQIPPELLEALLSGGGQMPETSMGEMTGAGGAGGEGGGGQMDEAALLQALQQLPPEVLQQLLSGAGGGGGDMGGDMGGGGGPAPDAAAAGMPPEAAMAGAGDADTKVASVNRPTPSQKKVAQHRAALLEIFGRNAKK